MISSLNIRKFYGRYNEHLGLMASHIDRGKMTSYLSLLVDGLLPWSLCLVASYLDLGFMASYLDLGFMASSLI
jgi:hypothetical protein